MARVLVVGGAGYVGSSTCLRLRAEGHDVWVLDDFSTGHRELILDDRYTFGRAGDVALVLNLLQERSNLGEPIDCVMHFAARSLVEESVKKPEEYYENNFLQTERLLNTLLDFGVRCFIFSSTCAVFGDSSDSMNHDAAERKINESFVKDPASPYGQTKLDVEVLLESLAETQGLRAIALRYFNAAGADPEARVGEWHQTETHLIPRVLQAASQGVVEIYGTDYPTPDGTCVRDYVHVSDLAQAHIAGMKKLLAIPDHVGTTRDGFFKAYNLGSEQGFSVREVLDGCEVLLNTKIKRVEKPRRPGDRPYLVADSRLAKEELGFMPHYTDLQSILKSAWNWEKKLREKPRKRAVFLDRDGTLNFDPGYLSDPRQMTLLPTVGQALADLKSQGFLLVVISNQSGVGRGLIQIDALFKIHEKLDELLGEWSVRIDHYGLCFHVPTEECECRKPKARLISDAATKLGIDVSRSYMVGDKYSDILVGKASGCIGSILVRTGDGLQTEKQLKSGDSLNVSDSLQGAANWILENAES